MSDRKCDFLDWVRVAYGPQLAEACDALWPLEADAVVSEDTVLAEAMYRISSRRFGSVKIAESICESDFIIDHDD